MDQEIREAFDRLDAKIDAQGTELRGAISALDAKIEAQGAELRGEIAALETQLRAEIVTQGENMRRHLDVAVEKVRGDFRMADQQREHQNESEGPSKELRESDAEWSRRVFRDAVKFHNEIRTLFEGMGFWHERYDKAFYEVWERAGLPTS